MRRRQHKPEWTLQAIREGQHYGALYEAFDEEDARRMAADFLSYTETRYREVVVYRFGAVWETHRQAEVKP